MTLRELADLLRSFGNGNNNPHWDGYADLMDVFYMLSEEPLNKMDLGHAGGLQFSAVHLDHVIKVGLEEMIKAHRHIETARAAIRTAQHATEAAQRAWEKTG